MIQTNMGEYIKIVLPALIARRLIFHSLVVIWFSEVCRLVVQSRSKS